MRIVAILVGGALGALGRYTLSGWIYRVFGASFPWGTLGVNLIGAFALGVAGAWVEVGWISPIARAFWLIGFWGAFTTFSTFMFEGWELLREGRMGAVEIYLLGSILGGLIAVQLGWMFGTWWVIRR